LDIDILHVHLLYMCNRFTGIYQALTGSSWIQLLQMTSDLPVMRSRFSLFLWIVCLPCVQLGKLLSVYTAFTVAFHMLEASSSTENLF